MSGLDAEEDLVGQPLHIGREPSEAGRMELLRQREERGAHLFRVADSSDAECGMRPFRDAELHLGQGGTSPDFVVPHFPNDSPNMPIRHFFWRSTAGRSVHQRSRMRLRYATRFASALDVLLERRVERVAKCGLEEREHRGVHRARLLAEQERAIAEQLRDRGVVALAHRRDLLERVTAGALMVELLRDVAADERDDDARDQLLEFFALQRVAVVGLPAPVHADEVRRFFEHAADEVTDRGVARRQAFIERVLAFGGEPALELLDDQLRVAERAARDLDVGHLALR